MPLAIVNVLEDEIKFGPPSCQTTMPGSEETGYGHGVDMKAHTLRRPGLISSLQVLGQFSGLLCPPASVVSAANGAARKAASFTLNSKSEDCLGGGSYGEVYIKKCVGFILY